MSLDLETAVNGRGVKKRYSPYVLMTFSGLTFLDIGTPNKAEIGTAVANFYLFSFIFYLERSSQGPSSIVNSAFEYYIF